MTSDLLFERFLDQFDFFATGLGLLLIAGLATTIFLFWEWRSALVTLLLVQLGVVVIMVNVHLLSTGWAWVQLVIMALCTLMLGLSASQMRGRQAARPPGPILLRCLVLVLLLASWRVFDLHLSLPLLNPPIVRLFLWLGLCALTTLALSDSPFFTGVALLLWGVPIHAAIELIVPGHSLFVLIGMMQIVVTLACSYLLLIDITPLSETREVATDITFPTEHVVRPALPGPERRLLPDSTSTNLPARPTGTSTDTPIVARGS
jgi:hypothetical protein